MNNARGGEHIDPSEFIYGFVPSMYSEATVLRAIAVPGHWSRISIKFGLFGGFSFPLSFPFSLPFSLPFSFLSPFLSPFLSVPFLSHFLSHFLSPFLSPFLSHFLSHFLSPFLSHFLSPFSFLFSPFLSFASLFALLPHGFNGLCRRWNLGP